MPEQNYISWVDFTGEERMIIAKAARDILLLEEEVRVHNETPHPFNLIPVFKLFDLITSPELAYSGKKEWLRNYIKRIGKAKGFNGIYPHTFPEDIAALIDSFFPS